MGEFTTSILMVARSTVLLTAPLGIITHSSTATTRGAMAGIIPRKVQRKVRTPSTTTTGRAVEDPVMATTLWTVWE